MTPLLQNGGMNGGRLPWILLHTVTNTEDVFANLTMAVGASMRIIHQIANGSICSNPDVSCYMQTVLLSYLSSSLVFLLSTVGLGLDRGTCYNFLLILCF